MRHTIDPDATRSSQPLALRVVRRDTPFDPQTLSTEAHIQEVYAALAPDERRTEMIIADTLELTAQGGHPIVLTERRGYPMLRIADDQRVQFEDVCQREGTWSRILQ